MTTSSYKNNVSLANSLAAKARAKEEQYLHTPGTLLKTKWTSVNGSLYSLPIYKLAIPIHQLSPSDNKEQASYFLIPKYHNEHKRLQPKCTLLYLGRKHIGYTHWVHFFLYTDNTSAQPITLYRVSRAATIKDMFLVTSRYE